MRSTARATALTLAAGLLLFVVLGLLRSTDEAFTLGASNGGVAVQVKPGQQACQGPIAVPDGAAYDGARQSVGTYGRPGPQLRTVLHKGPEVVARATVPGGYRDGTAPAIRFGREIARQGLTLCIANMGRTAVGLYGNGGNPVPSSALVVDSGADVQADLALTFTRPSRSLLATVPDVLDRAALFRSPRLPAMLLGVLVLALVAAAGWTLVAAMRAADPDGVPAAAPEDPFAGRPRPRTMTRRDENDESGPDEEASPAGHGDDRPGDAPQRSDGDVPSAPDADADDGPPSSPDADADADRP